MLLFQNKNTGRSVKIIKRQGDLVHVEYTASKHKAWYCDADFTRLFKLIPE